MSVQAFVEQEQPPQGALMLACRDFVHSTAPGLQEAIKWGVPVFMASRNVLYLNAKPDHVVLGFCDGAKMVEFHGVFDEVKAEVAHVRVRSRADLERPGLREAIRAAVGLPN